jgi:hypothetical protein
MPARRAGALDVVSGASPYAGGGDHVTAGPAVDPFALLTATEAASYAGVSVAAVCNWTRRGHLPVATDDAGKEIRDIRGRRLYRLVDVAKADVKTARNGEEMARRLAQRAGAAA